jgi:hypothetical protein
MKKLLAALVLSAVSLSAYPHGMTYNYNFNSQWYNGPLGWGMASAIPLTVYGLFGGFAPQTPQYQPYPQYQQYPQYTPQYAPQQPTIINNYYIDKQQVDRQIIHNENSRMKRCIWTTTYERGYPWYHEVCN